jgi:hypothetical protein
MIAEAVLYGSEMKMARAKANPHAAWALDVPRKTIQR